MAAVVSLKKIVRPYRPSNGTEGACFQEQFCCGCIKDAAVNRNPDDPLWEEGCKILAHATAEGGAPEWIQVDDGPMCTAYVPDEGQDPNQPTPRELEQAGQTRLF